MKVIEMYDIEGSEREVKCPNGGFVSYRYLLESDNMGFTLTKTVIPRGAYQHWHYTNHLEACFCISGKGYLKAKSSSLRYEIKPDTMYALDSHDDHEFRAEEEVTLICVFNPPLKGREIHREDGSYE